jgi:hypothetical protein
LSQLLSKCTDVVPQFTDQFQKSLHGSLGTSLDYGTAFHQETDGQTERVNQLLEHLLRVSMVTYNADWEKNLPYVEFSYNNIFQVSLKMAPFEALYDTIDVVRGGGASLLQSHHHC